MRQLEARCELCKTDWICEASDGAEVGATFCESCREAGRVAPGVLNWKDVGELEHLDGMLEDRAREH